MTSICYNNVLNALGLSLQHWQQWMAINIGDSRSTLWTCVKRHTVNCVWWFFLPKMHCNMENIKHSSRCPSINLLTLRLNMRKWLYQSLLLLNGRGLTRRCDGLRASAFMKEKKKANIIVTQHYLCFMTDITCVAWLPQKKAEVRTKAERYPERTSRCCVCTYRLESNEYDEWV